MTKKLLVICGPTATGKTSLALKLAKEFNGEIVSADSRQVYRGMDIGTGKEWDMSLPAGRQVKIWGYDLVDPKEEFSVSHYLIFARKIIDDIEKRKKLPILVGGTGLYIRGVTDGIPTVVVPRNVGLRNELEEKSVERLYETLSQMDSLKAGSLNSSDKKNPRRLVRAIEVAQYLIDHTISIHRSIDENNYDILFVGLTAPKEILNKQIEKRVKSRLKLGIKEEIGKLIKSGVSWEVQSMMSLGYRQWRDYFEGVVDEEHVVEEWKKEERKYAKRQLTWFKKDERIRWFDITDLKYPENVEKLVKKWYINDYAKKS